MLNTIYQLVKPRQFEVAFEDISIDREHVLVRPTYLSICNADERYYQGKRAEDILRQKLPMALIHEGIGRIIYDPTGSFETGERVVFIPNIPCEEDPGSSRKLSAVQQISWQQYERADAGIYSDQTGSAGSGTRGNE